VYSICVRGIGFFLLYLLYIPARVSIFPPPWVGLPFFAPLPPLRPFFGHPPFSWLFMWCFFIHSTGLLFCFFTVFPLFPSGIYCNIYFLSVFLPSPAREPSSFTFESPTVDLFFFFPFLACHFTFEPLFPHLFFFFLFLSSSSPFFLLWGFLSPPPPLSHLCVGVFPLVVFRTFPFANIIFFFPFEIFLVPHGHSFLSFLFFFFSYSWVFPRSTMKNFHHSLTSTTSPPHGQ